MPFGIVAYALMLFSWTTFLETAVYHILPSNLCFVTDVKVNCTKNFRLSKIVQIQLAYRKVLLVFA